MKKTWITSDLHFGHANIQKFCPATRSHYPDVQTMNEMMIIEWNSQVQPDDYVYILGDVAFMGPEDAITIVKRLNGIKHLIEGNHDRKLLQHQEFRDCFRVIEPYLRLVHNNQVIVMSHFPFLEWDQMHRGSLHFFGHLHGSKTNQEHYRCMDVGMDATGKVVMPFEEAISKIANNQIKPHH